MKRDIVLVDLDGTLADGQARLHLLPSAETRHLDEAWAAFNLASVDDEPITATIAVVNSLYDAGYYVVILTGRGAVARQVTEDWLEQHGVQYHSLVMREIGDCRPDVEFKTAMLERMGGADEVLCAFDDLPHIVDLWRSFGITTYEVTRYRANNEYVVANQHHLRGVK